MVKEPTPEQEVRRRICRARKVLTAERVRHVNRVKGLLMAQGLTGYEPLRRDRRARPKALTTGDGWPLPQYLKSQISRELDRLELLLTQLKAIETDRDALLCEDQDLARRQRSSYSASRVSGPSLLRFRREDLLTDMPAQLAILADALTSVIDLAASEELISAPAGRRAGGEGGGPRRQRADGGRDLRPPTSARAAWLRELARPCASARSCGRFEARGTAPIGVVATPARHHGAAVCASPVSRSRDLCR